MKITKSQLQQIIKEELENVLNEYSPPTRQQAAEKKWGKKGYERARKAAAEKRAARGRQDEHLDEQELQEESAYYEMLSEGEVLEEAEYQGRKVTLNKPMKAKGNVVKVNFGDPNMKIRKSNPKARKSFRARHNCKNPGPKWKARYWSCKAW